MTTKSTTEIIQSFLPHKDPLTELNKIRNVLNVIRDDISLAQDGKLDLCLYDLYSMLDTCSCNLDCVIEFLDAMQAEVIADMEADNINFEFMKVH